MLKILGAKVSFAGVKVAVSDGCDLCQLDECPRLMNKHCPYAINFKRVLKRRVNHKGVERF